MRQFPSGAWEPAVIINFRFLAALIRTKFWFVHGRKELIDKSGIQNLGVIAPMAHKFDPARMGSLTSERRQEAVQPLALLQRAGVQTGETILDWGCGAGFFAVPAARLVGETGRVLAVDVQPEMVAETHKATEEAGLANIKVMTAQEYELPAGLADFDWVMLAYVLHEVHEPRRLIELAKKALRPDGRLLIVEWPQEVGPHGPPAAERLSPADLAAWYEPLGFIGQAFWEASPEYYALVLHRANNK
jgi:ubiquinone/menaquinone biosynthesis C-methylase UbiE